jgi:restriction system protein
MKSFYRVRLGQNFAHTDVCFSGNFIGLNDDGFGDLTGQFPEDWRSFNRKWVPVMVAREPDKSRISAGLACGTMWTVAKGIHFGDVVLCPDGSGAYRLGEVIGEYSFSKGEVLPHRRPVKWLGISVGSERMSEALRNSVGSPGTVRNLTKFAEELQRCLAANAGATIVVSDETVEDPTEFAMELHLQEFLVKNWAHTELGKDYDIFEEGGEKVGAQYQSDTGPLDILAVRKDKKELLVVELKKGRASDAVVGQVLR